MQYACHAPDAITDVSSKSSVVSALSATERAALSETKCWTPARAPIASALAEFDVVRTFHRAYRDEMHAEFRWDAAETGQTRDGIDLDTLELAAGDRKGLEMMRNPWK